MVNYTNFESEKVKKFWKDREKNDKKIYQLYFVIGIAIVMFILIFLDKLNLLILFSGTFLTFIFVIGQIYSESEDLRNRINILEEQLVDKESYHLHVDNMKYLLDKKKDKEDIKK
ncbi:MAG: hypothetical protein NT068_00980 [Candidatus Nomurabacteria bacterium]|nr:hypothetical protein [Candidatus Nomurabacteria bacterium]